jgi:hypothetical protein
MAPREVPARRERVATRPLSCDSRGAERVANGSGCGRTSLPRLLWGGENRVPARRGTWVACQTPPTVVVGQISSSVTPCLSEWAVELSTRAHSHPRIRPAMDWWRVLPVATPKAGLSSRGTEGSALPVDCERHEEVIETSYEQRLERAHESGTLSPRAVSWVGRPGPNVDLRPPNLDGYRAPLRGREYECSTRSSAQSSNSTRCRGCSVPSR